VTNPGNSYAYGRPAATATIQVAVGHKPSDPLSAPAKAECEEGLGARPNAAGGDHLGAASDRFVVVGILAPAAVSVIDCGADLPGAATGDWRPPFQQRYVLTSAFGRRFHPLYNLTWLTFGDSQVEGAVG
jgi:hypothetical protein